MTHTTHSPARAAAAARLTLKGLARPIGSLDASRYFRGTVDLRFHNVGTVAVRRLARSIDAEHAEWTLDDAVLFADMLIVDPYLEVKGVGIELLACHRREFTPRLLTTWKRWLANGHAANWATTDAICGSLIGPVLVGHPGLAARGKSPSAFGERGIPPRGVAQRSNTPGILAFRALPSGRRGRLGATTDFHHGLLAPKMRGWARHRSLWVRRASAVSLIPSLRKGAALDLAYDIASALSSDQEDLIQKAVGWMLREAGKADPARLDRYLRQHGPAIPRTTVRYAIERFPRTKRLELLRATRT